jgi:ribosomal protein L11 methyltransferase
LGLIPLKRPNLGFKAYIPEIDFNENQVAEALEPYRELFTFTYDVTLIPQKNWNEVWESNFEPITIGDKFLYALLFTRATPRV